MLKQKKRIVTRRRFLAVSAAGAAGLWAGRSEAFGARIVRGFVNEVGRPIVRPKARPVPREWNPNDITAAWLGHSTVLVNFYGLTILTDPVLMPRIGADIGLGTLGPKRLVAPALPVGRLPKIDLVLLSHAHFDHFDLPTLKALPAGGRAITARRTADLLVGTPLKCATELGWGDKITITATSSGGVSSREAEVEAFEVRHWGARWRHDKYRGYNGYIVAREGKKIIFGGDTALTDKFRPLRSKGPFELAIMPIGSYKPFECSHCTPEQAVQMTNDAGAKYLLPIHHKTFPLGCENRAEPLKRLENALESERIGWREVGETFLAA
jgi:L-ascorbate metabolism protein UlaG (beta-lactamase superfamily)